MKILRLWLPLVLLAVAGQHVQAQQWRHLKHAQLSITVPGDWIFRPAETTLYKGKVAQSETVIHDVSRSHYVSIELCTTFGFVERFKWYMGWNTWRENRFELVRKLDDNERLMPFTRGTGFLYRYDPEDGSPAYRILVYYVTRGTRCYHIMLSGPEVYFAREKKQYRTILKSIRFDG